ncbi:hypothetical protein JCM5353_007234 [Sporobolomyces roseus]
MATTVPDSALAPKVDQLSSPSSHAGSAARPVTEFSKEEPRVVGADLRGPYDANKKEQGGGGVGGIEKGASKLTVNSLTETGGLSNTTASTGEHLEGIEPQGARKHVDVSTSTPSTTTTQKPVADIAEEKLRIAANTASNYLPSQETQQQAFNQTSAVVSSTVSAAASGATYAGNIIIVG